MTDMERVFWVTVVVALWLLVCVVCWRRQRSAVVGGNASGTLRADGNQSILVAWASQSGTAERLARRSAEILQAHCPVRLLPLSAVDEAVLLDTRRAFFVASTYGEGEPPDNGVAFQRRYLNEAVSFDLSHLEFAVLALGDRAYQRFCAFGRQLQAGLERLGARPMGALTETDRQQGPATDTLPDGWWQQLTQCAPQAVVKDPAVRRGLAATPSQHWLLRSRDILNPGSPGAPLYRLCLTPVERLPEWRAGDIVEVQPCNSQDSCAAWLQQLGLEGSRLIELDGVIRPLASWLSERQLPTGEALAALQPRLSGAPESWLTELPLLPLREYSAASVPAERELQLLVRLHCNELGEPGLGSGWLGQHAQAGDIITTRLRSNPAFHGPDPGQPMILIGAGSGLAGLRAHLVERALSGRSGPNWLLFGERSRRCDRLLEQELQQWLASGHLARLDRVFSREEQLAEGEPRYVQDMLQRHRDDVHLWVSNGAAIYVCGSLNGMGSAVNAALENMLGSRGLADLRESGRYRRDLY